MKLLERWRKYRANRRKQKRIQSLIDKGVLSVAGQTDFNPKKDGGKELDWNADQVQIIPTYYAYDDEGNCTGLKDDKVTSN